MKSTSSIRYLIWSLATLLAACGHQHSTIAGEKEAIMQIRADWPKRAQTRKPDQIAWYFADDAIMMGQEQPPIKGKAAIIQFFSALPPAIVAKVKWAEQPSLFEVSEEGNMAWFVDQQTLSIPDSTGKDQIRTNRVLHIWTKDQDGNWKVSLFFYYPEK